MAKWRLFGKPKESETTSTEENTETNQPIAEYKETLETEEKYEPNQYETEEKSKQTVWRDVNAIEKKVDRLHITRAEQPNTELDRTVDRLLQKRKRKY